MIEKLISFDTTSRDSNLKLIYFVRDFLSSHQVDSTLIFNDDKSKANLFATVGPEIDGGVVLSGHSDVVPVDGQNWTSDPFKVVERDGLLYGRGTADMKSFLGIALALVPEMTQAGLKRPIHLAISYDEEIGCIGVRSMIDHISSQETQPMAVIVGEPTDMKVINAHKGIRSFRTTVTGVEAHSSQQQLGVNAIIYVSKLISFLDQFAADLRDLGDPSGRFEPGYTTIQVGTIEGGTAVNIIPKECAFGWEYRWLPNHPQDEIIDAFESYSQTLLAEMRLRSDVCTIVTKQRAFAPGLSVETGSLAESLALALAEQNETRAVSYGTEAGLFQAAQIPTVICGPGDIAQAHIPDEFISLQQIEACEKFIRNLIAVSAA
jgi:acetylornithine deacetylase